jgi:hypothetical protein
MGILMSEQAKDLMLERKMVVVVVVVVAMYHLL